MLNVKKLDIKILQNMQTMELIWSNPSGISSQTSTMGEAEVEVASLNYDGYLVEFRSVYNDGGRVYQEYWTGATNMYAYAYSFKIAGNPIHIYRRSFYPVAGSKIHFGDCVRVTNSAAPVVGSDTGCLVPLRIWGINKRV